LGIERTVRTTSPDDLSWPDLVARLTALGEKPVLRMIDGLPAFPDETPEAGWKELRLGLAGGMATVRRTADGFACVTWGTSDDALRRSWDRLCHALASAVGGQIVEGTTVESPAEFAARVGL
jgi:hypothetical protein